MRRDSHRAPQCRPCWPHRIGCWGVDSPPSSLLDECRERPRPSVGRTRLRHSNYPPHGPRPRMFGVVDRSPPSRVAADVTVLEVPDEPPQRGTLTQSAGRAHGDRARIRPRSGAGTSRSRISGSRHLPWSQRRARVTPPPRRGRARSSGPRVSAGRSATTSPATIPVRSARARSAVVGAAPGADSARVVHDHRDVGHVALVAAHSGPGCPSLM